MIPLRSDPPDRDTRRYPGGEAGVGGPVPRGQSGPTGQFPDLRLPDPAESQRGQYPEFRQCTGAGTVVRIVGCVGPVEEHPILFNNPCQGSQYASLAEIAPFRCVGNDVWVIHQSRFRDTEFRTDLLRDTFGILPLSGELERGGDEYCDRIRTAFHGRVKQVGRVGAAGECDGHLRIVDEELPQGFRYGIGLAHVFFSGVRFQRAAR